MRIYVDADGFPGAIREILIRAAQRLQVPLVFVANKRLRQETSVLITCLIVPEGPDVADDRIVALAEPGDLVITADIPLADRVVAKGVFALDYRGKHYTEENIKDRLALRDLLSGLRDGGLVTGGPAAFGKKDCHAFANALDSLLVRQRIKTP
jgi:hypothetical protein